MVAGHCYQPGDHLGDHLIGKRGEHAANRSAATRRDPVRRDDPLRVLAWNSSPVWALSLAWDWFTRGSILLQCSKRGKHSPALFVEFRKI